MEDDAQNLYIQVSFIRRQKDEVILTEWLLSIICKYVINALMCPK